tara:strand:- start:42 stop:494 length:453 start_codon:yes stop_codon:yes gene_type:complete
MDVNEKKRLLNLGLRLEDKFIILIKSLLTDTNISIVKTDNKFCCIDFILSNGNKQIGIELKSRGRNLNMDDDYFIGVSKLHNIKLKYNHITTLLVWSDKFKNVYFTTFKDELLNSQQSYINYGDVYRIKKDVCVYGLDELVKTIKTLLLD